MGEDFKLLTVKVTRHGTFLVFNRHPGKFLGPCPGTFRYFNNRAGRRKSGFKLLFPREYRYKDVIEKCNDWMALRGHDYRVDESPYIVLPSGYREAVYSAPYKPTRLKPESILARSGDKEPSLRVVLSRSSSTSLQTLQTPKIINEWVNSQKPIECRHLFLHLVTSGAHRNSTAYSYVEVFADKELVSRTWVSGGNLSSSRLCISASKSIIKFASNVGITPKKRLHLVIHDYLAFMVMTNQMPLRAWGRCRIREDLRNAVEAYKCPVDICLGHQQSAKNLRDRISDLKFNDSTRTYVPGVHDTGEELQQWITNQRTLRYQAYLTS